jgi:aminoglycoside/choline kinase family phosphotransferase
MMGKAPFRPEDVTHEWLTEALGTDVRDFSLEQIGIGVGLLGRLYRITARSGNGTVSAVAKFPTLDEGARMNVVAPLRFYEKEVSFYSETAKQIPIATPGVLAAEFEPESGDFALLLEDLGSRRMADQVSGCPIADAETAVDALVALHSEWWNSASFPAWLPSYADPPFPQVIEGIFKQSWPRALELFGDHITPTYREFGERFPELVPWFMEKLTHEPTTFCHGDFRLDNLFYATSEDHAPLTVVDWQICFRGPGGYDLAYFVSQSLGTDVRRRCERDLKKRYLDGLARRGVDYPEERFLDDYARTVAYCFIYPIAAGGQIEQTNDRMRDLLLSLLDRAVQAIEDNKALELLPS